jgi:D-arabinose 1-dehydrogenase-like Zn-dependent alcohol dehydrogenase
MSEAHRTAGDADEGVATDETLARYQGALLDALADARQPEDVAAALLADASFAPYHDAVRGFEARALEVGMGLVHRWGEREINLKNGEMRVAELVRAGAPFVHRAAPLPMPGPGELRLRVEASGLCGTDVHLWRGDFAVPLPVVPGHEPVGVIDALGPGLTGFAVGERVGVSWVQTGCERCAACARQQPKYCAAPRTWARTGGGHAQWMLADARGCTRVPAGLTAAEAAPLFCAGFTAMSGFRRARPRPGEVIGVLGLGGLGHLAVQIARAYGHEVVAVTSSASKREDALALGADEVLAVQTHAGHELAALGGVDVLIGTSSDLAQTGDALFGLRPGGRLVALSLPVGEGAQKLALDPRCLLERQLQVVGAMQDERADLVDVLALAAEGAVTPWLERYPFAQLGRAMARLAERRVRYRAVLEHAPP